MYHRGSHLVSSDFVGLSIQSNQFVVVDACCQVEGGVCTGDSVVGMGM